MIRTVASDGWYTVEEAAELTGLKPATVANWCRQGKWKSERRKHGKPGPLRYHINPADVERYAAWRKNRANDRASRRKRAEQEAMTRGYRREDLVSIYEGAARLGISRETLWKRVKSGTLEVAATLDDGMVLTTLAHIESSSQRIKTWRRNAPRDHNGRIIGHVYAVEGMDMSGERMVANELGITDPAQCDRILEAAYAAMVSREGKDWTLRQAIRQVTR